MAKPITIVRRHEGSIDEVYIDCNNVHLERMDDNCWCLIIQRGKKILHLSLAARRAAVETIVVEDELGAVDDTKESP